MSPSAYFSVDIKADGPIPGPYSMLSIGAALAGYHDDAGFYPVENIAAHVFYRELRPISDQFAPDAVNLSGLDRDDLITNGTDPAQAMHAFSTFVHNLSTSTEKPVFVGYPAGYDFLFTYWYLIRFTGDSVFGRSNMLDLTSFYAGHTGNSARDTMPHELISRRRQTHRADDDAMEQAELFIKLMRLKNPDAEGPRPA